MAESDKSRGYRIIIAPLDGRESRTIAVSSFQFKLIVTAIVFIGISFCAAILLWGTLITTKSQNRMLQKELNQVSEQATRVALIEKNMVEMDRSVRYIRLAMSLTGDSTPPSLEEFMTNDSLTTKYEESADSLGADNIPNIAPCDGWASREYNPKEKHFGIDYAASVGTLIRATANGTVTDVRFDVELGNLITIDHGNGFITRFAHCNETKVLKGKVVKRGETIATVGSSGKATSGPHCHYEIIRNGKPDNPGLYILKGLE